MTRHFNVVAACLLLAGGCAIDRNILATPAAAPVTLEVTGVVDPAQTALPNLYRVALAPGTPEEVVSEIRQQLLPSWGREDLIAADYSEYASSPCTPLEPAVEGESAVLDAIVKQAAQTSIVIVNESHYVTRQRDFIAGLLERLRPLGYSVYAAEGFHNEADKAPPIELGAALPYARYGDGNYTSEPTFARLIRRAKALGFRLVPYEMVRIGVPDPKLDAATQMNAREIAQADNLARFLAQAPAGTKMIVHVGYSHAGEKVAGGVEWMASRLKRATGVDPLTIGQTDCHDGTGAVRLVNGAAKSAVGTFDLNLQHPLTQFEHGRPSWRFAKGDRAVPIPPELRPADSAVMVEARLANEPDEAVPVDRVYARPGDDVVLALPPGRYRLRAVRTDI